MYKYTFLRFKKRKITTVTLLFENSHKNVAVRVSFLMWSESLQLPRHCLKRYTVFHHCEGPAEEGLHQVEVSWRCVGLSFLSSLSSFSARNTHQANVLRHLTKEKKESPLWHHRGPSSLCAPNQTLWGRAGCSPGCVVPWHDGAADYC